MNNLSNDDLARLLQHNGVPPKPGAPSSPQPPPATPPAPPETEQPHPESLAAKHRDALASQQWSFGRSKGRFDSLADWEMRALFVALTKGTKANLLREPTVAEFGQLVDQVEKARDFLSSVEQAIESTTAIHLDEGEFVFSGAARRLSQVTGRTEAA